MEIVFLGTGAGVPARERNVSSLVLRMSAGRGVEWMFDCGEATQHRIAATDVRLARLDKIFISHLHGDHILGLPGLLSSRSFQQAQRPLTIYGPEGIRNFVQTVLSTTGAHLSYPLSIEEIGPGVVFDDGRLKVTCDWLDHGVPCLGYRVAEHPAPGRLLADQLRAAGVPEGPLYARLKAGESVQLDDGRVLDGRLYVTHPLPGRVIAIIGDTAPCEAAIRLAKDADVLVHEATFAGDKAELAAKYRHSTAAEAAAVARAASVRTLVLTHISPRYSLSDAATLLAEARLIHPDTFLAEDGARFHVSRRMS